MHVSIAPGLGAAVQSPAGAFVGHSSWPKLPQAGSWVLIARTYKPDQVVHNADYGSLASAEPFRKFAVFAFKRVKSYHGWHGQHRCSCCAAVSQLVHTACQAVTEI